jgi:hypothetical protein
MKHPRTGSSEGVRWIACLFVFAAIHLRADEQRIDGGTYHLGVAGFPEWAEFRDSKAHGRELHLEFTAPARSEAATLLVTQDNVRHGWSVELNGHRLGTLEQAEQKLVSHFRIPPGTLKDGTNRLSVRAPKQVDDIRVGNFRILDGEPSVALKACEVNVEVTEILTGNPLPSRLTVIDEDGALAALVASGVERHVTNLAARAGVIYTIDGRARIGLRPGAYTIYASRGFEYGVATNRFKLAAGTARAISLAIGREVLTPGMVSVDPHIHTRTFSGHGDATVDERMLTIAGEGIELAVATDHNIHTDYRKPARAASAQSFFTPVIGNEVTTKHGHFNAFPVAADAGVPDYKQTNWTRLIGGIRAVPGVRVVSLNHPRNVHSGFSPTASEVFDPVTAEGPFTPQFTMDAMEVLTSAAMQSDIMRPIRDWFALLNYGHRITGLGSSDTHDVNRYLLGQGRTYVFCEEADASTIDVAAVCDSILAGRALISFGLLTEMTVNERFRVGDLVSVKDGKVQVRVTVSGPSWVTADKLEIFANGLCVGCASIAATEEILKREVEFELGPFPHDVFLVAVATGPGLTAPFWDTPRPYQPDSPTFTPRFLGATNPIRVDGDGDGDFTPAREYARRLVRMADGDKDALRTSLVSYDGAVAAQAAALMKAIAGP